MKVLHIAPNAVFMQQFIEFVDHNFSKEQHTFAILCKSGGHSVERDINLVKIEYPVQLSVSQWKQFVALYRSMMLHDRIVLHGLNELITLLLLSISPHLLAKSYWFTWGAEIYKYNQDGGLKRRILHFFAKKVINRVGFIVLTIEGEYRNIKKLFSPVGQLVRSFKYPSNLYKGGSPSFDSVEAGPLNILLGNAATKDNNHVEAMEQIHSKIGEEDIRVYCPLSYGDKVYADQIEQKGRTIFGDRFISLREFMPLDDYIRLLLQMDVAVMNAYRQKGMGNMISLLGAGKKVYMNDLNTSKEFFESIGVHVYAINDLDKSAMNAELARSNHEMISAYFSKERLKTELSTIFGDTQ